MRKFTIKNGNGVLYELNGGAAFFSDPSGLGIGKDNTYTLLGDTYYTTKSAQSRRQISGTINFITDPYASYFSFCRFLQCEPLTLIYNATGTDYSMRVKVDSVGKTELTEGGILSAAASFTVLGLPYETISKVNSGDVSGIGYNYTYPYIYSDDVAETITFNCDSYIESPCRLSIYGPCTDPEWSHYVNGTKVSGGAVTGTIEAGHKLVIDNTVIPYSIQEVDANTGALINDMYQASDFSTQRFIYAQNGENRISISHASTATVQLAAEAHILYETV